MALSRRILNNPIWTGERYSRGQAWVEIIALAEWEDNTALYRGQVVHKERGTIHCSLGWLADRWGWNRKTVAAFLDQLQAEGMTEVKRGPYGTIIRVVKYDDYQPGTGQPNGHQNGQPDGHPNGYSYPQDHGQPKNGPQTLQIQGGTLSDTTASGHPEKGQNGQHSGQGSGQRNGQRSGHKLINNNNINNFKKQEEADRLSALRERRDRVNRKWRNENEQR